MTEQIDLCNYSDYDMHLWGQEGDNFPKLLVNEQMLLGLFLLGSVEMMMEKESTVLLLSHPSSICEPLNIF